jgi:hypothetical protein
MKPVAAAGKVTRTMAVATMALRKALKTLMNFPDLHIA